MDLLSFNSSGQFYSYNIARTIYFRNNDVVVMSALNYTYTHTELDCHSVAR